MANSTIRIIAGKQKGQPLEMADSKTTRSSKSILKESLFNVLSFEIHDSVFVEVFAGSGSIGLEAISRGAKKAYFFEKNRESFAVLKRNTQKIAPQSCEIIFGDSFENLPKIFGALQEERHNVYFYFDPPFHIREGQENIYEETLALIKRIPMELIRSVIIEHISSEKMPEKVGNLKCYKSKKFGKSTLSYYRSEI